MCSQIESGTMLPCTAGYDCLQSQYIPVVSLRALPLYVDVLNGNLG